MQATSAFLVQSDGFIDGPLKIDALIASFNNFKSSQLKSNQSLEEEMSKFKTDLKATKESHEEATEQALKCIRMDRPQQFQRKGHKEQYRFNADIQDHVAWTSRQLKKLAPQDKEKPIVQMAMKELKEGSSSLAERQKHIRFADQAENGWDAVVEYIGYSFADDEEDDRKLHLSDRAAGVKKRQKAAANAPKPKKFLGGRVWSTTQKPPEFQGYGPPNQHVATRMMPYMKQRGPCYQCGQLKHIKANSPKSYEIKLTKYNFTNHSVEFHFKYVTISAKMHSSHKWTKWGLRIICEIMHATGKYLQGLMGSAISKRAS